LAEVEIHKGENQAVTNGGDMIKRLLFVFFASMALLTGFTGCHTVHGAGEDVESVGDKIQEHTPP
jgi:predicted small secreted protein